jgi:cystatin-A/B
MKPGGLGKTKKANLKIILIAYRVKSKVEEAMNTKYKTFIPLEYASQVVSGMNYFIKVYVGKDNYLILRIFQDLKDNVKLLSILPDQTATSSITYF